MNSANSDATAKKNIKKALILSIIAGVLVVVMIAGLLTNWFGLYGPGAKIVLAGKNTLATKNFTITYSINGTHRSTIQWDMDPDAREFTLVVLDPDGKISTAIYKGYRIYDHSYGGSSHIYATDIRDDLDGLFNTITRLQDDLDTDAMLEKLDKILDGKLSELFDLKKLSNCLTGLYRDFNSDSWLKDNVGFSKDRSDGTTLYHFRPDTYRFLNECLATVRPALRDGRYEDLRQTLDKNQTVLSEMDYEICIGIEKKKLTSLQIHIADLGDLGFEFSRFGGTSIQTEGLDRLLEQAKYL